MFDRSYDLKKTLPKKTVKCISHYCLFVYFIVSCFEATGPFYKVYRGYKQVFFFKNRALKA